MGGTDPSQASSVGREKMARSDLQRVADAFIQVYNESGGLPGRPLRTGLDLDQFAGLLADGVIYEEVTTPFEATTRDGTIRRLRQLKEITPPQLHTRVEEWIIDEETNVAVGRIAWILEDRPVTSGILQLAFDRDNRIALVRLWILLCFCV
jgi:hypothetical protein